MRDALPAIMQTAGIALAALGIGLVWPALGVVAAGAGLFLVGLVLDLPRRRP